MTSVLIRRARTSLTLTLILTLTPVLLLSAEIHDAIQMKNISQVRTILSQRPTDINSRTKYGLTPLHQAAAVDAPEIASVLISRGADLKALSLNGLSPLHTAIRKKSAKTLKVIITQSTIIYTTRLFDKTSTRGKNALASGDLDVASDLIFSLLRDDPSSERINFTSGLINSALDKNSHAALAYERVLQLNPKNDRARLELAKAYIATKQHELAREQLEIVRSHKTLPSALESDLSDYAKQLKRADKKWSLTTRLDVGAFMDDNINVGPNSTVIDIKPVVVGSTLVTDLYLSESSTASDATGFSGMLSLIHEYDIGEKLGWNLLTEAVYYQTWLESEFSDYENVYGILSIGPRLATPRSLLQLKASGTHIASGGDPLLNMYGIKPKHITALDATGRKLLTSEFTAEIRDYDTLDFRDSTYFELKEKVTWYIGEQRHHISAGGSLVYDITDNAAYTYKEVGVKLAGGLSLPGGALLYTDIDYSMASYDEAEELAPEPRDDKQLMVTAGLSKVFNAHWGADLNHVLTDNNSEFKLYEYDRNVTTLTLYYIF
ncbi:hypothetical protein BVX97_06405 [bacterium E08(2017)]|nr:hypothetical protein BVX97_06405 [bacterium E08(2017)]